MVLLKKPARDVLLPTSHRPISMLNCLKQVFEKTLFNRLDYWAISSDILSPAQCGFRKRRITLDALTCVVSDIYSGFKGKQSTFMACLDIESAYDTVDVDHLCCDLA